VKIPTFLLILISVTLSAIAQIMLKAGVPAEISSYMGASSVLEAIRKMIASPLVVAGLGAYGLGALVWLFVLSRVDVTYAYPFLALGLVLTMALGAILLGEHVGTIKIIGTCLIGIGIVCIANA
jgi:drug/metabolite transporter (DMT)-like permease